MKKTRLVKTKQHEWSYYSADEPQPLMQNFTKFYNDRPVSGHKRRGEEPWQDGWHPKRFGGPGDRWSPNHGQNRSFNRPTQAFRTPDPRPQPTPSRPRTSARGGRGRRFNPTRVKPLTSYPAASLDKTKPGKKYNVLLTADNPPSPRVEGILEMALGTIFKDIHKLHSETAPPLPFLVVRNIKQTIRDRIREVMIGKVVGKFDDVVKAYRAKYAADTDKEVLASAESRPVPKRKFIDQSESPREYFEANMTTLLRKKIDEMFDKLKGLYNEEKLKEDIKETMEEIQAEDEAKLVEAEEAENASITTDVDFKTKGETNELEAEETEAVKEEKAKGKEAGVKTLQYRFKYYEKLMQDLIKMQLPDALPNYKEKILDLLDIDEEYKQTKFCDALLSRIFDESPDKYFKTNMSTLLSKKMDEMFDKLKGLYNEDQLKENIKQTIEEMQAEDKAKSAKAEEAENDSTTTDVDVEYKGATKEEKAEETEAVKEEKTEGKEVEVKTVQYSSKYYEKLMQDLIKKQLPDTLPKYKETILALLDIDKEYKQKKASIILKTEEIASHLPDKVKDFENSEVKVTMVNKVKTGVEQGTLFSVKIVGRPRLPNRTTMKEFLEPYNPSIIKQLKTMRNFMFVAFREKADFERVLNANQIMIGTNTLDIKMNLWTKKANATRDSTAQDKESDSNAKDDSKVTELGSKLDNKIDDLVTSIRQEKEKLTTPDGEHAENTEPVENADKTEAWENGDGIFWDADNNEVTWEGAEGETVDNQPEETESGVEIVEGNTTAENAEEC